MSNSQPIDHWLPKINNYRTRVHIYFEILEYVATAPRLPTHIMRKCNLETGKFNKYVQTLTEAGLITTVSHKYLATIKANEYLKDRKISEFLKELS